MLLIFVQVVNVTSIHKDVKPDIRVNHLHHIDNVINVVVFMLHRKLAQHLVPLVMDVARRITGAQSVVVDNKHQDHCQGIRIAHITKGKN